MLFYHEKSSIKITFDCLWDEILFWGRLEWNDDPLTKLNHTRINSCKRDIETSIVDNDNADIY